MVVKRVGPLSVAKNAAVLYAVLGLIFGAFFSLAAMAGAFSAAGQDGGGAAAGVMGLFGLGAIIFLPIFYACLGFVGALIMCALYNIVASMVGGIEVDLQ